MILLVVSDCSRKRSKIRAQAQKSDKEWERSEGETRIASWATSTPFGDSEGPSFCTDALHPPIRPSRISAYTSNKPSRKDDSRIELGSNFAHVGSLFNFPVLIKSFNDLTWSPLVRFAQCSTRATRELRGT